MIGKQMVKNIITNSLSFAVSFAISFFLTPYITAAMGEEAYGFISLGNNFVSYVSIITAALNSMASRFITVELHKGNPEIADQYFSSVSISNAILTGALVLPTLLVVIFLDRIIRIPLELVSDTRWLFFLLFFAFFINLMTSVFSIAPYARNRTDLSAYRDILYHIVRACILMLLFGFFVPHVWYYGLSMVVSTFFQAFYNIALHKKLLGNMKIRRKDFRRASVITLLKSGVWSSISSLSSLLIEGLDLLIANLFINASAMGILSIAKTIPLAINAMVSTVSQVFVPSFTIQYAKGESTLVNSINSSIKFLSILSSVPLVMLFVLGKQFYQLWVPSQNCDVLYILSLLTIGSLVITAAVKPLYAVYIVTNRLKWNSLSTLIQGIISTGIVFLLLNIVSPERINDQYSPIGLYIIAGTSSSLGILRALTFVPMYASKCLNLPYFTFYPAIFKALLNTAISSIILYVALHSIAINSWIKLVLVGLIVCVITLSSSFFVVLNKDERNKARHKIVDLLMHTKKA